MCPMNGFKKTVIAIDGPAASGKGTLARKVAEKLNFAHMDTGALYRATAFEVIDCGLSIKDAKDAVDGAQILVKKIENASSPDDVLGNPALRQDDVGQAASKIAAIPRVREVLNDLQRDFAKDPGNAYSGAVLDGRDIGTVICPDADFKFFVTADVEIRAERRLKELQSKGLDATYGAVLSDMRERDERDSGRKASPMRAAEDATVIDSSDLSPDEMLDKVLKIVEEG